MRIYRGYVPAGNTYIYRERDRRSEGERRERRKGEEKRKEGRKRGRGNDLHLPLLNFKLSQLFPQTLVVLLTEACHPYPPLLLHLTPLTLSLSLSFSLSLALVDTPKAPLNLAHRTNGLLYASAYTGNDPILLPETRAIFRGDIYFRID